MVLQQPTGIICAINGNFFGGKTQEIAVARGSIIDLLRPEENGKIEKIQSVEVFGAIECLAQFRLSGEHKDCIVVGSDSGRIIILEYNKDKHLFDRVHQGGFREVMVPKDKFHQETFGKSGCLGIVPHQCLAVDPKGRAVMIGACGKQKLVYVLKRETAATLTISSPLEVHTSHTICYSVCGVDCGFDNPTFAAIELDYSESDQDPTGQAASEPHKHLNFYELDLGLNRVCRTLKEPVESGANMLVTVPGGADGPSGVLVCAECFLVYRSPGHPHVRAVIPRRTDLPAERGVLVVSATAIVHKQTNMLFFLIQTDYGDVFKVTLDHDGNHVSELKIKYFGTIPVAASICVLKLEFIFSASESGNHGLYRLQERDNELDVETFQPRQLKNLVRIDPVESLMSLMDVRNLTLDFDVATREQLIEVEAAKALSRDHEFSFNLQMEEAIAASLASHTAGYLQATTAHVQETDYIDLGGSLYQQMQDRLLLEKETQDVKIDLDRRLHDYRFAKRVNNAPQKIWKAKGDSFQSPYTVGDSYINSETFHIFCKGLVQEHSNRLLTGIGIGICASSATNHPLWIVKKVMETEDPQVVELVAVIEGLKWALELGFKNVQFYSNATVLDHVKGGVVSTHSTVASLVKEVFLLQTRFSSCKARLLRASVTFVHQFAEAAIASQCKESCRICLDDDFPSDEMFEVEGCLHRFCSSCMKQFLRTTLVAGKKAICPSPDCRSEIQTESCACILDPKELLVIEQHKEKSLIHPRDRVFCPDPTCSHLMAKHTVLKYTEPYFLGAEESGARKCMKCGSFFCIKCEFKWHYGLSCEEFQKTASYRKSLQAQFESAAEREGLKKCRECSTVVERTYGCNRMICPGCNLEFCYTCGAEWRNKKATCKCRL